MQRYIYLTNHRATIRRKSEKTRDFHTASTITLEGEYNARLVQPTAADASSNATDSPVFSQ